MITIVTRIALILADLRKAVATFASRQDRPQITVWLGTRAYVPIVPPADHPPIPTATWLLLITRLGHVAKRLHALFARWQAGTLAAPRPSRAGQPATPRAYIRPPYIRLPSKRLWVTARVRDAAPFATQLEALFAEPDFPQFLAAIPQAGRLLRPLCHMLGAQMPPILTLPPRPRAPRAPKPPRIAARPRIPPPLYPALGRRLTSR